MARKTVQTRLPRTAVFLGIVSLLNDAASESIYPLLPIFLTETLGAGPGFLGFVEGLAESTASIVKYFAGTLSDRVKRRDRIVLVGYSISNFARPVISVVASPFQFVAVRFFDRVGKGIRSAPRDAWLSAVASPKNRGHIFSFHRAMDNLGAAIGPIFATAFLYFMPNRYRLLFAITAIPGLISLFFIAKAPRVDATPPAKPKPLFDFNFQDLSPELKRYLFILLLFTLGNFSDTFLILRLKNAGIATVYLPLLWTALHFVKVGTSLKAGGVSDNIGRKKVILLGWFTFAATNLVLGLATNEWVIIAAFLTYGAFAGFTEGVEKALVSDLVDRQHDGKAFGLYNFVMGIALFPASLFAGLLWERFGAPAPFIWAAVTGFGSMILLLGLKTRINNS